MFCYTFIGLGLMILHFNIVTTNFISQNIANKTDNCDDLLHYFSLALSNYTYCNVINAKPVRMCENCADSYFLITETYKQLTKTVINGTACIDNFINLDRLQIITSLYKNANDLWNKAKCSECISFTNGKHSSTKVKEEFDKLFTQFSFCTEQHYSQNSTIYCTKCMPDYINLNKFYFTVADIAHGIDGICMDIVDLMNKTQANWSSICCHFRVKNEDIYIITTVFMILLPILFYCFVKLFVDVKKRKLLSQNRFPESMNTPSTSS